MKKDTSLFAAIHLGSEQVSLQIVEYTNIDSIKVIELASKRVSLGEETFKTGKISFSAVNEVCELLKGYRRMLIEYGVRDYRLIATTAIREAANQQYIIDQIKIKTGFTVDVVDMMQEIFYKYVALFRTVEKHGLTNSKDAILFVDISSGGLGITLYQDGAIKYQQNIHIGVLRIKESFEKYQRDSSHFQQALAEYIFSVIEPVQYELSKAAIKYLVLSGIETKLLLAMLGREPAELAYIGLAEFNQLYNQVKMLNLPQIMKTYNLSEQKAEMVLPTIILYKQILSLTDIGQIVIPDTQLFDGITGLHIAEKTKSSWLCQIDAQIISLVRAVSHKFRNDNHHAKCVEEIALRLFDKLMRVHGLSKRERTLLQVAAILHDIGKFVSLRRHYFYSYRLIRSHDLLGFSEIEKILMANVAHYHSKGTPHENDPNMSDLTNKQKVTVAKLAAIIRLADAVDRTHRQKVKSYDITFKGDDLVITVQANEDLSLEVWTFEEKVDFFQNVFGIRAVLQQRS